MIGKSLRGAGVAAVLAAMLTLSAGSTSAAAGQQQGSPVTAEVTIDNFSFGPATLTVTVGTRVTWINRDDIPHTVVSSDGVFKSKVLDTDEKFSYTAAERGTFPYFCSIHPKMTGTLVVR